MTKKKVYVVPHSHWDREWYFSIEDSNILLTENMRYLIDFLENNPQFPSYTFDGQLSVIEEYLKIVPEDTDRIKNLILNKRLFIGPWYTQADTLLIQTESIIRNLLIGQKGAKKLGYSMNIGYLPDIFGQQSYLPSIFKRFGIEYSILQRGLYNIQIEKGLNFYWESPNQDKVCTNNLFFGYGPGKFLSSDMDYVQNTLLPILDTLLSFNPNDNILLPAGGDQVLIREHFPGVIEELNQLDLDYEFILSDYETYMKDQWGQSADRNNSVEGELIACQQSRIHNTIRSQRIDIKLANSRIEEKIYQQLEPLGLMAQYFGGVYPQVWIETCLKLLFDVHAHDSIGGCNSDETNSSIISRLNKIERIVDGYINILKKQLSRGIVNEEEDVVVVFHLLPKEQKKKVKLILFTKEKNILVKQQNGEVPSQTQLLQTYISGGKQIKVTAEGEKEIELPGYYRTELLVDLHFSGFGYQSLFVEKNIIHKNSDCLSITTMNSIKNEYYELSVVNGGLILTRFDGVVKKEFLQFENTIDAGDSYDYSPLESGEKNYSQEWKVISTKYSQLESELIAETKIKVAANLENADQLTEWQTIQTTFTLQKNNPLIQIEHKVNNKVHDHRIRALFKIDTEEKIHYADQGYALLKRQNKNTYLEGWKESGFSEAPQPIYPIENMVGINELSGNTTLITNGLKEYEVIENNLALTLFRGVGVLGRDNLNWRPGRASGINNKEVLTPDAQMQGELIFHYHYYWNSEEIDAKILYTLLEQSRPYQLSYHVQKLNTFEERIERFELPQPKEMKNLSKNWVGLTINQNIFVSSMKKHEESQDWLIRLFNPTPQAIVLPENIQNYTQVLLDETRVSQPQKEIAPFDFLTIQKKNDSE